MGQPQNSDRVQSQVIVKKSTSSKPKAPTTVILRDSIVKKINGNIITKSVKIQKYVVVKHFSVAKIADMNHYRKPTHKKITSGNYNSWVQMIYLVIKNRRT